MPENQYGINYTGMMLLVVRIAASAATAAFAAWFIAARTAAAFNGTIYQTISWFGLIGTLALTLLFLAPITRLHPVQQALEPLRYFVILASIVFVLWITWNGIHAGFKGTADEKTAYIVLLSLLILNSVLLFRSRN